MSRYNPKNCWWFQWLMKCWEVSKSLCSILFTGKNWRPPPSTPSRACRGPWAGLTTSSSNPQKKHLTTKHSEFLLGKKSNGEFSKPKMDFSAPKSMCWNRISRFPTSTVEARHIASDWGPASRVGRHRKGGRPKKLIEIGQPTTWLEGDLFFLVLRISRNL